MRAITYRRVSTEEQGDSAAGLEAQTATLDAEVDRRGFTVVESYVDVASGKSLRKRPELGKALDKMTAGDADVLVVAKLDRLSRSMLDFAHMVDQAAQEGWSIVALDIGVDTSTTNGRMLANIIMTLAQWERELIGDRTRAALGAVRARGVKLGRPTTVEPETVRLIRVLRDEGKSLRSIASVLAKQGIPTAQGGKSWHASTVKAMLDRA